MTPFLRMTKNIRASLLPCIPTVVMTLSVDAALPVSAARVSLERFILTLRFRCHRLSGHLEQNEPQRHLTAGLVVPDNNIAFASFTHRTSSVVFSPRKASPACRIQSKPKLCSPCKYNAHAGAFSRPDAHYLGLDMCGKKDDDAARDAPDVREVALPQSPSQYKRTPTCPAKKASNTFLPIALQGSAKNKRRLPC
ncbi:hypothetical protein OF83DRAFT_1128365 [Amylostereum chailletii]|nr:hypothetical protein OF83DRAFT_1128365 [Amylostereum chailletii]